METAPARRGEEGRRRRTEGREAAAVGEVERRGRQREKGARWAVEVRGSGRKPDCIKISGPGYTYRRRVLGSHDEFIRDVDLQHAYT